MHPDLSPHLHTEECNFIIRAFRSCQDQHGILKYVGYCDPLFSEVQKCLRKERINRRIENIENDKMKMREYRARLAKGEA
ncbi:COX assembly mitochondrial protein 2 homolog [Saccostrea echinata]|uniref:COX assembly mitochondrial protein 2 homolog n=1 Tax=Saccostrea echinata TaxID=191078 RepID=UPI002A7F2626|nr:COX assembly mitochondrial protein 2 homolog [Saccostrea echinata]XP_061197336.1 COX assembly mitochondrial protein 2 homolog [Saccostrea echinata]